ncbi:50S ribosomal protein L25 [Patescibacteria group bacterium]|nr:50S ribosomal protein L25 [Patescibacteria group bacterium]
MLYELKAKKRDVFGKKVKELRAKGFIPAIIYGSEVEENVPVYLNSVDFEKIYEKAGSSALINLIIEGEEKQRETLIKDIDFDVVKSNPTHVDFYQIRRGQKLELEAELNFVGEAPAVKELGGVLIKAMDMLSIKCLPQDIVSEFNVDLSVLKKFDDKIKIKDLVIPENIEVLDEPEEVIALVAAPEAEEVVAAPAAEETTAAPAENNKKAAEDNGNEKTKK